MKKILPLMLLISFISSSLFSYDLKPNERIKQELISEYADINNSDNEPDKLVKEIIKKVDRFIVKIGDQNVLDIKVNFLAMGLGVVYIIIYKAKV